MTTTTTSSTTGGEAVSSHPLHIDLLLLKEDNNSRNITTKQNNNNNNSDNCVGVVVVVDDNDKADNDNDEYHRNNISYLQDTDGNDYVAIIDDNNNNTNSLKNNNHITSDNEENNINNHHPDNVFPTNNYYLHDSNNKNYHHNDDSSISSIAQSIATNTSVVTIEGIQDIPGFYCICCVILIGDMSRGVMFPTMWPLVKSLGGTPVILGYSVAAFSFGRTLVNPFFGYWCDTHGYRLSLFTACTILLFGSIMYTQIQTIGHVYFLIVSQIILGIGSGTLGVTRAFVADVTDRKNRTTYMAYITAVQYGGFTMTPIIGSFFLKVLNDKEYIILFGMIRWNMYTAPAYFLGCCVVLTIIVMALYLKDCTHHHHHNNNKATIDMKNKIPKRIEKEDLANTFIISSPFCSSCCNITIYDCCIIGCMMMNIATKGSIACFETLGIAIAQDYFTNIPPSRAGMIISICGTFGVLSLLQMNFLEQKYTDVQITVFGISTMIIGIFVIMFVNDEINTNPTWQYILSMCLIYSIGYPIGHSAVIGLFSKIIGRRPQGTLFGWFASAGSLARVLFPILSGYIVHYNDIDTLFVLLLCILLSSILYIVSSRYTLNYLSKR